MVKQKEKRGETPPAKSRLGFATFLVALAALVLALLAFWKVYSDRGISKPYEPSGSRTQAGAEEKIAGGEGGFDWNNLQKRYEELARLASDPDTYEQARGELTKLVDETRDELSQLKDKSEPRIRELVEKLNADSADTLSAMKSRASSIEEKLHGLADTVQQLGARTKGADELTSKSADQQEEVEPSDRIPQYR